VAQPQHREPSYREQDAKTITRLRGMVDPWFLARYGMNLYRGCEHGCVYCDGLGRAGHAIQQWARQSFTKRGRRKAFNGTVLEAEFRAMVTAGTLHELPGVTAAAAAVASLLVKEAAAEGAPD